MPKWIKFIVGLLLIPVCLGAFPVLWRVIRSSGNADTFWVAFLGGMACWWVVFLLLPKPLWIYVAGHELTHALWAWIFGGKVKKIKVGSSGGHVILTKNNFVISLAPYFFPFYVALVIVFFLIGHLIWDWHRFWPVFHLLIGAAYAFHITLTGHILKTRQTDITQHGYLFSAVIIFIGNAMVLIFGLPLLAGNSRLLDVGVVWMRATEHVVVRTIQIIHRF